MVASLNEAGQEITDFNKGNIKARERMVVQYGIAGANNGAVVGTDHAAENFSGFYTKYGDGAADLTPLSCHMVFKLMPKMQLTRLSSKNQIRI